MVEEGFHVVRFLDDELLVEEGHVGLLAEQVVEVGQNLDGFRDEREVARRALARVF